MSKSRYRPRSPRSAAQWFLKSEAHKRRQAYRAFINKVWRPVDCMDVIEPNERRPKDWWD